MRSCPQATVPTDAGGCRKRRLAALESRRRRNADGNACTIIPALFGMEDGRSANRAEPESEPRSAVADAHVFGGFAEYLERSSEAGKRREHAAGPSLARQAMADAGQAFVEVFCPIHNRLPSKSSIRNSVIP